MLARRRVSSSTRPSWALTRSRTSIFLFSISSSLALKAERAERAISSSSLDIWLLKLKLFICWLWGWAGSVGCIFGFSSSLWWSLLALLLFFLLKPQQERERCSSSVELRWGSSGNPIFTDLGLNRSKSFFFGVLMADWERVLCVVKVSLLSLVLCPLLLSLLYFVCFLCLFI